MTNNSSDHTKYQPDPNTYSNESHYRSEYDNQFTNISTLNTYPHGNYINNYNTIYSNEEYRPISSIKVSDSKLDQQLGGNYETQNQSNNYEQLKPEAYLDNQHPLAEAYYQLNQNAHFQQQPPPYQDNPMDRLAEYPQRCNDYIVNTPYTSPSTQPIKNKSFFARFCGQLFSIFLVIFMLLLSFLLIRSFQAGLTATYIARHNQNEWRKHDK